MSTPITLPSIAATQAPAPAAPASTFSLNDLAANVLAGEDVKSDLEKAVEDLANPDSGSVLRAQLLTAELSVMAAAMSGMTKSLTDTLKGVIQQME
ncbi:MAG: hypothetical protein EOO28_21065 [Comamonadaceae bacterium]|nr:MAG: hypothetical protein EOO28_21065 [Comamonadaceae bacterium]